MANVRPEQVQRPNILVICDDAGIYYALPQEALANWQVPDELTAAAAPLVAEQEGSSEGTSEVTGYTTPRARVVRFSSTPGLQGQDRMGNFEIQRLMSAYNQAETLASTVLKKSNDTTAGIIGKI